MLAGAFEQPEKAVCSINRLCLCTKELICAKKHTCDSSAGLWVSFPVWSLGEKSVVTPGSYGRLGTRAAPHG